jgi:ABC-type uncharacterized transport system fused permease/ATPase subunit
MQEEEPKERDRETAPSGTSAPGTDRRSREPSADETEDRQLQVAEMMVGTAMMFVGFLAVLLSISGGFEIHVFQLIVYFAGMALWAHAKITNATLRYVVIIIAMTLGAAFYHYGEVLFWHKQAIFWGTILLVIYFMFASAETEKAK